MLGFEFMSDLFQKSVLFTITLFSLNILSLTPTYSLFSFFFFLDGGLYSKPLLFLLCKLPTAA